MMKVIISGGITFPALCSGWDSPQAGPAEQRGRLPDLALLSCDHARWVCGEGCCLRPGPAGPLFLSSLKQPDWVWRGGHCAPHHTGSAHSPTGTGISPALLSPAPAFPLASASALTSSPAGALVGKQPGETVQSSSRTCASPKSISSCTLSSLVPGLLVCASCECGKCVHGTDAQEYVSLSLGTFEVV